MLDSRSVNFESLETNESSESRVGKKWGLKSNRSSVKESATIDTDPCHFTLLDPKLRHSSS